jgi:hypothetical protein
LVKKNPQISLKNFLAKDNFEKNLAIPEQTLSVILNGAAALAPPGAQGTSGN